METWKEEKEGQRYRLSSGSIKKRPGEEEHTAKSLRVPLKPLKA